eukprot:11177095-Lingulodinium_polyedra.AAC.1
MECASVRFASRHGGGWLNRPRAVATARKLHSRALHANTNFGARTTRARAICDPLRQPIARLHGLH